MYLLEKLMVNNCYSKSDTRNEGHAISAKVRNIRNSRFGSKKTIKVFLYSIQSCPDNHVKVTYLAVKPPPGKIIQRILGDSYYASFNLSSVNPLIEFGQLLEMIERIAPLGDLVVKDFDSVRFRYQLTCEFDIETYRVWCVTAPTILKKMFS
jgi:hypothetical protein